MSSSSAADHEAELAARARSSSLVIAVTALLVVPAWSGFDLVLEPAQALSFVAVRLLCDVPVLLAVLALRRHARVRPEALAFGVLVVVQTEIAWMVSRAADSRQFYLLGFTLALYGAGLLLPGRPRGTVGLVAVTLAALGLFELLAPQRLAGREAVAALTFLGTASIIAVVSHAQRQRLTDREFRVRASLEQERTHSRELIERVERLSREDPLTGLANRRRWDEALDDECRRAHRTGLPVAVVLLDVDHFKEVNDAVGHAGGDAALCWVARVMQERAPQDGLVARLGGDELAMLLPHLQAEEAAALAERVRRDVGLRRVPDAQGVRVSVSQGVASAGADAATPAELMRAADRALYRAKGTRDTVALAGATPSAAIPVPRRLTPDLTV